MGHTLIKISDTIEGIASTLAGEITERHYAHSPEFKNYGETGYTKSIEDVGYHLAYLSQAIRNESPVLFREYVRWADILFNRLKLPPGVMKKNLEITRDVLSARFDGETAAVIGRFIEHGLNELSTYVDDEISYINDGNPLKDVLIRYYDAMMRMDRREASSVILDAADTGAPVEDLYLHVFEVFLREIGRMWQTNRITVAQEHYCTAATQLIMSQLYPRIFSREKNGRVMVSASVSGELHEVGIRMVTDLMEMDGWDTYYLGANMPASDIIKTIVGKKADLVAISSTLMVHVRKVNELIDEIRSAQTDRISTILVGGYPFNVDNDLWKKVGADLFAANAREAVKISKKAVIG